MEPLWTSAARRPVPLGPQQRPIVDVIARVLARIERDRARGEPPQKTA